MTKIYTNGTKQIATSGKANEMGNVWYQSVREGKAFGRQFRMTEERFVAEFWEAIEWEPTGETLEEIIKRDRG